MQYRIWSTILLKVGCWDNISFGVSACIFKIVTPWVSPRNVLVQYSHIVNSYLSAVYLGVFAHMFKNGSPFLFIRGSIALSHCYCNTLLGVVRGTFVDNA